MLQQHNFDTPCGWIEGEYIVALAAGRRWRLASAGNLEQMWNELENVDFDDDCIPYWVELWPASLVLANLLAMRKDEITGQICLDLGCGLGLCAITGSWLGAKMIAMDRDLSALKYCRVNARLNHINPLATIGMDWRCPSLASNSIHRIWAGDIVYERRFFAPVADFMETMLEKKGRVWLAEPGREIFYSFIEMLKMRGWKATPVLKKEVAAIRPQKALITATVWEFERLQD